MTLAYCTASELETWKIAFERSVARIDHLDAYIRGNSHCEVAVSCERGPASVFANHKKEHGLCRQAYRSHDRDRSEVGVDGNVPGSEAESSSTFFDLNTTKYDSTPDQ